MIIVGIAISTILGSVNSMLLLRNDAEVALNAAAWGIGSLNGIDWKHVVPGTIFVIFLLFCAWMMNRPLREMELGEDRKSTRLNSSHVAISYAVFCLKKKKS